MATRAELAELIGSLERATARWNKHLDADIYVALGHEVKRESTGRHGRGRAWAYLDSSRWIRMENLTSSVEAALALVERMLPGCWWFLSRGQVSPSEPLYGARLLFGEEVLGDGEHDTNLSLAICIALFRTLHARAST